jgi:hypothetical protein
LLDNPNKKFSQRAGLLYFQDRLYVPHESDLQHELIKEFHSSPIGGHSGFNATLARLYSTLYWPGMYKDVKTFILQCATCQYNKYNTHSPYGLLQPLHMPHQVWEEISMDFITNLPPSNNKTTIWVVVDRLSKFAHFIALLTGVTAASLATIFINEIYRLHEIPKTIVSDRDRVFISKFWREFFKHLGTTLSFSSSYHPQTDGQTEVLNRCLETYLRCFVSETPKMWTKYLPMAEFWYNTTLHSAIGMTPFEALYGRPPPKLVDYIPGESKIASLDEALQQRHQILKLLKENLHRARNRMIQQANKKRTDKSFEPGQWVYLKLQPYRQVSVQNRVSQKLSKRYYGPFRILKRVGSVAYELELPPTARIHPVFHISLLKACYGNPDTQICPLPLHASADLVPLQILQKRSIRIDNQEKDELLIHWSGQPSSEATWEDKDLFKANYPTFDLEDKIIFDQGGNDTIKGGEKELGQDTNEERGPIAKERPKRDIRKPIRYQSLEAQN